MRRILSYLILFELIIFLGACNIKKHVPHNNYLLVKNEVIMPKDLGVDKSQIESVIKQRPNHRTIGMRLKLRIYNSVDSLKTVDSRRNRIEKYKIKNQKLLAKQERINQKRIVKAIKRGETTYRPKKVSLKDTIDPNPTLRERIKYSWGEPPVLYDSSAMVISRDQIQLFMQKKGYFHAQVETVVTLDSTKREAKVQYVVNAGEPYYIDSLFLRTKNQVIDSLYWQFLSEGKNKQKLPFRFDSERLANMRKSRAEYMRNHGIFGFKESYISFEVDTLGGTNNIKVAIDISKRYIRKDDEDIEKPFDITTINNVTFHLSDTMGYKGNFKKNELDPRGIELKSFDFIPTFDTLCFPGYNRKNARNRTATFLYNGKMTTNQKLIEFQNYMEEGTVYNGSNVAKTYNRLMGLNVFKSIKVEIIENDDNSIDVHYYLTPQKRHSFSFEPKATHNNSFLGVSASVNYVNRNLFRKGYQFTVSLSGGFESQPEVFGKNEDGTVINDGTRSFNTLEFGPSIEFSTPSLFPIPLSRLSKRQNPRTAISIGYNYQLRPDFTRSIYQFNYLWKFSDNQNQHQFTVALPLIGGIQFVQINKSPEFEQRLNEQNDLFLINAYSNRAIFKDLGVAYQYSNANFLNGDLGLSYNATFDLAGMLTGLITIDKPVNNDGYKEFLGQRYSQFIRLDNQFVVNQSINEKHSLHYRIQAGAGLPLTNNGPNLPFDYSFFGGGSNDNRGFRARSLGPGVYKFYLDTARTSTQMGDMRLGLSLEYRFKMSKLFDGALFSDIGNVWTMNNDPNRPGGQISKDFYKQLSLSAGLGLRLDFTFVIVRLDVGFPLRNPSLPRGSQWVFQSRNAYKAELEEVFGPAYETMTFPKIFKPHFHVAIGYPF